MGSIMAIAGAIQIAKGKMGTMKRGAVGPEGIVRFYFYNLPNVAVPTSDYRVIRIGAEGEIHIFKGFDGLIIEQTFS